MGKKAVIEFQVIGQFEMILLFEMSFREMILPFAKMIPTKDKFL